jgi:hypothetical protein
MPHKMTHFELVVVGFAQLSLSNPQEGPIPQNTRPIHAIFNVLSPANIFPALAV